jgi:hypothetical protein
VIAGFVEEVVMAEVLLPIGVPIGPHYTRGEGPENADWQVGVGVETVHPPWQAYTLWSVAFGVLPAEELALAGAAAGVSEAATRIDELRGERLLVGLDPQWPTGRLYEVFDRLHVCPRGVGHGNLGPDRATYVIRSQRGDVEVRCGIDGYWAYFGSQRGTVGEQLRTHADGWTDAGSDSAAEEVAELLCAAVRGGLAFLDWGPSAGPDLGAVPSAVDAALVPAFAGGEPR